MKLLNFVISAVLISSATAVDTYNLDALTGEVIPGGCTMVSSPNSGCFAEVCQNTIRVSPTYLIDPETSLSLPKVTDFKLLASPTCLVQTDTVTYDQQGEQVFIQSTTVLLDKTPEYFVLSKPDLTSFQVFNGDGSQLLETISLQNAKMTYGSTDAICSYDLVKKNVCRFQGVVYDVGEMCAHTLVAVG